MSNQNIVRIIKALLSKTVNNGATEAEQESALRKAADLMAQHSVAFTDVEAQTVRYIVGTFDTGGTSQTVSSKLAVTVAKLFDVQVYKTEQFIKVFGVDADVDSYIAVMKSIKETYHFELSLYKKTADYICYSGPKRTLTTNFFYAYINRLYKRLEEIVNHRQRAIDLKREEMSTTGTAMVIIDKAQEVKNKYDEFTKDMRLVSKKSSKPQTRYVENAANAGTIAANRTRINYSVE